MSETFVLPRSIISVQVLALLFILVANEWTNRVHCVALARKDFIRELCRVNGTDVAEEEVAQSGEFRILQEFWTNECTYADVDTHEIPQNFDADQKVQKYRPFCKSLTGLGSFIIL